MSDPLATPPEGWKMSVEELEPGEFTVIAQSTDGQIIKHSGTDKGLLAKACYDEAGAINNSKVTS